MGQMKLNQYDVDYDVYDDNHHVMFIAGVEILIPLNKHPVEDYELRFLLDLMYWLADDAKTYFENVLQRITLYHFVRVMTKTKYPNFVAGLEDVRRTDKVKEFHVTKSGYKIFLSAMLVMKTIRGQLIFPFDIGGTKKCT